MKHWKKLRASFAAKLNKNIMWQGFRKRRVLCAVALAALAAISCFMVYSASQPVRYTLETAGNVIDFADDRAAVHTADDGIAIVNGSAAAKAADTAPAPAAQVTDNSTPLAAPPTEIWQSDTAQTHSGFTLPVPMDGDSIGVLTIPALNVSVRVYESDDDMADMAKGAAHFKSTSAWEGNIGLSAHNINFDGTAGYFRDLYTLKKGAVIRYETALGVREYAVESVAEIAETDWSGLGRTEDNRITLITCISGKPTLRLSVQAVEKQG
ncbi:hypothetical protein FACS1894191_4540 [Clostridia bacterium]|nr:hypothetical protein FACS1894191_4540 [Clostridia bacterium]